MTKRFGQPVLAFTDPDGMGLALVGVEGAESEAGWTGGDVPAEHAIRGFHGVTLMVGDAAATGAILTDVLGFAEAAREDGLIRYRARAPASAASSICVRRRASCRAGWAAARCIISHSAPQAMPSRPRWRAS